MRRYGNKFEDIKVATIQKRLKQQAVQPAEPERPWPNYILAPRSFQSHKNPITRTNDFVWLPINFDRHSSLEIV
jgi:hypothetical protein